MRTSDEFMQGSCTVQVNEVGVEWEIVMRKFIRGNLRKWCGEVKEVFYDIRMKQMEKHDGRREKKAKAGNNRSEWAGCFWGERFCKKEKAKLSQWAESKLLHVSTFLYVCVWTCDGITAAWCQASICALNQNTSSFADAEPIPHSGHICHAALRATSCSFVSVRTQGWLLR